MKKIKTMIQSLDRAMEILEIVRDADAPVRAKDIADAMGLESRTAHNLIRSLYLHGLLAQDSNRSYLLGSTCLTLGGCARRRFERLGLAVREPVRQLCRETGNTVFVGTEYYGTLYCVARAYPDGFWEVNGQQKWINSIHSTASGKILIADHGEAWFAELLEREKLEKFTEHTICTLEGMREEIAAVRHQGYALCVNENSLNSASLAVELRRFDGILLGALTESFPDYFLESGRFSLESEIKKLRSTAAEILRHC